MMVKQLRQGFQAGSEKKIAFKTKYKPRRMYKMVNKRKPLRFRIGTLNIMTFTRKEEEIIYIMKKGKYLL